MEADLEEQVIAASLTVETAHGLAHLQSSGDGAVRRGKRRHHGIAYGFHDRSSLTGDNLVQNPKMRAHEIIRRKVSHPLVELGRSPQVGEQERQARDLEPLVDVERVRPINVPKGLVREQALGGQEWAAMAEDVVEIVARNADIRQ